jgi:hypothetical protein
MVELARTVGAVILHPDAALVLDKRVDKLRALGVEVFVWDELEQPDSLRPILTILPNAGSARGCRAEPGRRAQP